MSIKSYILIPKEHQKEVLAKELLNIPRCERIPAENKEVIIAVTDTTSEDDDKKVYAAINQCPSLAHITLVSGFDEKAIR